MKNSSRCDGATDALLMRSVYDESIRFQPAWRQSLSVCLLRHASNQSRRRQRVEWIMDGWWGAAGEGKDLMLPV